MIRFRRKDNTRTKIKENFDQQQQIAKARRLSQDMRKLSAILMEKATELEGELNHEQR